MSKRYREPDFVVVDPRPTIPEVKYIGIFYEYPRNEDELALFMTKALLPDRNSQDLRTIMASKRAFDEEVNFESEDLDSE